jgi:hypothetical protein
VIAGPRRLRFWRFRETRNKVVYQEEFDRGDLPVIGQVYISKDALETWGNPSELEITITPLGRAATAYSPEIQLDGEARRRS